MKTIYAVLAVVALAAAALAADGFSVTPKYKKGDVHKYALKVDVDFGGQQATVTGKTSETVTDVAADGTISTERKQQELKLSMSGNDQDIPDSPALTMVYKPNGELKTISGENIGAEVYRSTNLELILDPGKPLSIGDTWSHTFAADTTTGAVAGKTDYKLLGEEKVDGHDTLKIDVKGHETGGDSPAGSEGTMWIDKADGSLVKASMKWTKMPVAGAPMPVDGTMTLDRS